MCCPLRSTCAVSDSGTSYNSGNMAAAGGRAFASTLPLLQREVQAEDQGVKQQNDVATVVGGGIQVGLVVRPEQLDAVCDV